MAGVAGTIGNVVTTSLRPRLIPDRQLGKVSGASRAVGYGAMPLGALLGGWAAQVFGIPAVLVGVAVVFGLATVGSGVGVGVVRSRSRSRSRTASSLARNCRLRNL